MTRRTDCSWLFSPSFGWGERWALFSLSLLTLLNCLGLLALSAPLCCSLQLRIYGRLVRHLRHHCVIVGSRLVLSLYGRGILQQRVLLSEPCVTFTRFFPSRVLLTVSLCLVHVGVPTSLNSVARLLLNAVFRLLLNVSDATLSFLPGTSRASCTSEPAWRLSGPCASASNSRSAGTHQHLLDLTVASTVSSESSAPVFPLCTLHGVLITPLASFSLSE